MNRLCVALFFFFPLNNIFAQMPIDTKLIDKTYQFNTMDMMEGIWIVNRNYFLYQPDDFTWKSPITSSFVYNEDTIIVAHDSQSYYSIHKLHGGRVLRGVIIKIGEGKYMIDTDSATISEKGLCKFTQESKHAGFADQGGFNVPVGYYDKRVSVKNYWVKIYPNSSVNQVIDNTTAGFRVGTLGPSNSTDFILTSSGLIEVPIIVNDVLKINFILDSGASEVSITPDVALTLVRTGTVTQADWLPGQMYTLADGSTTKSNRFIIRSLNIAGHSIKNISCSISGSIDAPMLLGENVLSKFGKVIIDYQNQRISFED